MPQRHVLKENEIFAVSDLDGNIHPRSIEGQGLYFRDTRFLNVYEATLEGVQIQLLSSAGELNFMNNFQFGNLPTTLPGGVELPVRTLSMRRNRFIDGGLHERIGLRNYNPYPVPLTLRLVFGSDFRDMFDVRGYSRPAVRGTLKLPQHRGQIVRLRYLGLDKIARTTRIRFDEEPTDVTILPAPADDAVDGQVTAAAALDPRIEAGPTPHLVEVLFNLTLGALETWSLSLSIVPVIGEETPLAGPMPSIETSFQRILEAHEQWESGCTRIHTDHELLNALITRSLHDLRLTTNRVATGLLPVAGIPWFAVPFGRDSEITALQTLCLNPDIAYGTLRFLAQTQGKVEDPWRDEEPGKILHEVRSGELAALGQVPQTPYYGSIDSTPLFVCLLGELEKWTGDAGLAADLRPSLEAAAQWVRRYGDRDGDGLLEYLSRSSKGIQNQGWKDSWDAISWPDGSLAETPIAVAEVQGYAYGADLTMADLYGRWGESGRAEECLHMAARRKERFESTFWLEDQGFYAMALDASKRTVPAPGTNVGHCFLFGLLDGPRGQQSAERMVRDDLLCGWGLRTLSSDYPTFNPMSYHNGSVWPHDNSLVAAGLRRAGHQSAAVRIIDQVFQAGSRLPGYRMPELFCGFSRDRQYQSAPAEYPVSCSPQAWAAGSVFLLLQHLMGIEPDLPHGKLSFRPALLPWLNEIRFEGLRLGQRRVDLAVWRAGSEVRASVSGADGLMVTIEPVQESLLPRTAR